VSTRQTTIAIICVVTIIVSAIILVVLMIQPAQAQDIGGATSDSLYLPAVSWTFPMWFTDQELTDAMIRDGYDPNVAGQHVNCFLDPSSTPPDDLRWSSCEQYYINGIGATEGTSHYIWWLRLNDGRVHGVEVGGTMVSASGDDAPCYTEDTGEVVCG